MKYLIYCTKAKPYLAKEKWNTTDKPNKWITTNLKKMDWAFDFVNGKIVAEFECDKVEDIWFECEPLGTMYFTIEEPDIRIKSCLTEEELLKYLGYYNKGYAIHIKNLKVFEKPLELKEVFTKQKCEKCLYKNCKYYENGICRLCQLTKAPQNMCYCYYNNELCCLISIRPKWVCKILNGEKTIEVRKKVLKGML